jgi:hypothetical protein
MNLLKSKLGALAAVALLATAGSVQAGSFTSYTMTTDTATNLDVSWVWDLSQASLAGDSSVASLSNWSAEAWGWKQALRSNNVYFIDVVADRFPGALTFEYEAGNFSSSPAVSYSNSAVINGRTYTLSVATDANQANLWNIHLTGVAPIPEPGEWALMLSGFGLIALMVRRRTANAS